MTIHPQIHKRLIQINAELSAIEKRILKTAIRLDATLSQEEINGVDGMYDYELDVEIECYGGDESGYPLCTLHEFFKGISSTDRKNRLFGVDINHNEFQGRADHPMKDERHCWLYHCLYDHEYLSWKEIASIQRFCFDIIPRYQYSVDSPSPILLCSDQQPRHFVYSNSYDMSIDDILGDTAKNLLDSYPLDLRKFNRIRWNFSDQLARIQIDLISDEELSVFHTPEYLSSLYRDKDIIGSIIRLSIPEFVTAAMLNDNMINSARAITAGTVHAAQLALRSGWAINIGGGFHHAHADKGGGFCFFNDYAIATHKLRENNPDLKILYVDLDAHIGDGVISFANNTDNFYILDLYNTFTKLDQEYLIKSDSRNRYTLIGLNSYTGDELYLKLIRQHLPKLINSISPDIIFYNGGSDVLKGDTLGHLSITPSGMKTRDLFVFGEAKKRKIPIMMCLSGGYGKENYQHVCNSLDAVADLMKG